MIVLISTRPKRRIAIVSETHALVFQLAKKEDERNVKSCSVELIPKKDLANQGFKRLSFQEIYGFIGLISVQGLIFVGTITGKSKVAQPVPGETVNKIFAVDFFCLSSSKWDFIEIDSSGYPIVNENSSGDYSSVSSSHHGSGGVQPERHPCYELRKLLSNGSFYFSSNFDLTSILQNRGMDNSHSLSFDDFEKEYMWNSFLMDEIITYRDRLEYHSKKVLDEQGFLTVVIRGFAETFVTYVKKLKVSLTVISKQSWKRAGTRFNVRGVDDEANVANFVETEVILFSNQYCFSFTQIRGSVPIFWEQDTSLLNPKVSVTRSIEATQPVFDQHFCRLNDKYGPIHIVNLLSETKSSEVELSRKYKKHLSLSKVAKLGNDTFLTEFDFHRETAQEGFSGAKKLLPHIMGFLLDSGYFSYDVKEKKIISEQQGVFRTNCLDCLDRTNLIQQVISQYAFKTFLEDFQLINGKSPYINDEDFMIKHNALWADHGDQVSQIYTGTNALKSSFSRKGKMSLAGALSDATKSVSRMYINNFMDQNKQLNIDSLLGRLPDQEAVKLYDPISDFVTKKLDERADEFTSSSSANIFVGTFNVNGTSRKCDLSKWIFPIGDKFKPDIVVLGLQEVIEMTAGSILNADYSKGSFWENMVKECLNQYDEKYFLLRVEQMSSLIILFFVKSDKAHYVKQVEGATKKTGFGGITGNKGSVAIRFNYGDTSFCFVNAHFSAGASNVDERRHDYESIMKSISFTRSKNIKHHDSIFWFGDLNYRITLMNEEVRRELTSKKEGYIENLLRYDQLTQEINSGALFHGFKEPTLKFRPTYKYDLGTEIYDTSEKARTPSWTDRIVYRGANVFPLAYSDALLLISDHRPVYAAYRAKIKFIDEEKKIILTNELYNEYKLKNPDAVGPSNNSSSLIEFDADDKHSPQRPTNSSSFSRSLLEWDNKKPLRGSPPLSPRPSQVSSVASEPLQSKPSANSLTDLKSMAKPELKHASMSALLSSPPPPPSSRTILATPLKPANRDLTGDSAIARELSPATSSLSISSPPEIPKARKSLPPGFSDIVLTPKSSNINSNASSKQSSISNSSDPLAAAAVLKKPVPTPVKQNQNNSKTSSTNSETKSKKVPPVVPTKKPSLENATLDTWKPLTPK